MTSYLTFTSLELLPVLPSLCGTALLAGYADWLLSSPIIVGVLPLLPKHPNLSIVCEHLPVDQQPQQLVHLFEDVEALTIPTTYKELDWCALEMGHSVLKRRFHSYMKVCLLGVILFQDILTIRYRGLEKEEIILGTSLNERHFFTPISFRRIYLPH